MNQQISSLKSMGYQIITCFRNPVDRWLSHYLYAHYRKNPYGRIEKDIDEFLESEEAKAFGSMYVRYLGGPREDRDYISRPAVEGALNNLEVFTMVGFLNKLDIFRSHIREDLGINLRFKHKRISPAAPERIIQIRESNDYRKAILEHCSADMEIYEQALVKFSNQNLK